MARGAKNTPDRSQSKTRKAEQVEPKATRPFVRVLRGLLGLALLGAIFLTVGSIYIRREVLRRVHDRSLTATSAVFARPFPIYKGLNVERSKLRERMNRLAYRSVSDPEHAGEYSQRENVLRVFLRSSPYAKDGPQEERLVEITLNPAKEVDSILDTKFQSPLDQVYLEPELLSLLGDTATRASLAKPLKDFPPVLIHALLAIEDERFYSHFGIDPQALVRAVFVNLTSGRLAQGGSTLTQQLAKNLFFSQERSFVRKIFEAAAAVLMETALTKDQILELYLNEVFLAQEGNVAIHGFAEASRSFFGHEVEQLTLAEAATLAGIIKAPTRLSPRLYPKNAKERRGLVLQKMAELKYISEEERNRAALENLKIRPAERTRRAAPYFVDYIRRKVQEHFELETAALSRLRIITGLDLEYQSCADKAVEDGMKRLEQSYPRLKKQKDPVQVALISVNPIDGEILSWVGGRDYGENQFDRVSQSKRQPGSSFKPFVYLTALDKDLNTYRVARTTSLLTDEPMTLRVAGGKTWEPKNYDEGYRGEVTVREALAHSLNIPTVQLAMKVGIENVAHTAELFGFGNDLPRVPSLALGAGEVSPFDLARAYAAIANGGQLINLRPFTAVLQENDPEPLAKSEWSETRIASEPAVYVLTNMMQSVLDFGTAQIVRRMGFTAPAAGKTGTSNDTRDAWFAGFTPRLLTIVWVGFDDNTELKLTGAQAAAPIWTDYMKCAAAMEPQLDFVPPPGVVFRKVDKKSGLLFTPNCPPELAVEEVFVEGTEPITPCPLHNRDVYTEDVYNEPPPSAPASEFEILSPPSAPRRSPGLWDKIWGQ